MAVEELFRTLSAHPSTGYVAAIAHENARLRQENGGLRHESTATVTMIKRLSDDLGSAQNQFKGKADQLQGLVKDKEALAAQLMETEKSFKASVKKASTTH